MSANGWRKGIVLVAVGAGLMTVALAGCGHGSVTGPQDGAVVAQDALGATQGWAGSPTIQTPPPAFMDGYFGTTRAAGLWDAGSTQVVIVSWGDPTAEAARTALERRVSLLLSVHHCFWWDGAVWAGCLARTREWAAPLLATGRVVGVYGPDEPMGGGMRQISHATIDGFVAATRAAFPGLPVVMAETYDAYERDYRPAGYFPRVDYFGLTAYYIGNPEWVLDRMHEDPRVNMVFASSDNSSAGGYQKDFDWADLARRGHARGILRWSLDLGAAGRTHRIPRL